MTAPGVGEAGLSPRPQRHRRLMCGLAWFLLSVGVASSVVGGVAWRRYQHAQAATAFRATTSDTSNTVGLAVWRDLDMVSAGQELVATSPTLNNRRFDRWVTALDPSRRYPGSLGFGFIEPVPAARLAAFAAAVRADPPTGTIVGSYYSVFPPGHRASYCLARLAIALINTGFPIGVDFCAPTYPTMGRSYLPALLSGVESSGRPAIIPQVLPDVFALLKPVYRGGTQPATISGRRAAFAGWFFGIYRGSVLVDRAAADRTGQVVTVSASPVGRTAVVGRSGSVPHDDRITEVRSIGTDIPLQVRVVGTLGRAPTEQGLVLAGIGIVLSALLFTFLLHLARSRDRALRLVEERTAQLRHLALHDTLTGLPNRSLLFDRAQHMLDRAARGAVSVGALFVDLDNFKEINDTYGHEVGDQLLRSVAGRLSEAVRTSDTVGRLGGDEFLVLSEGEPDGEGPEVLAGRLLAALAEPFELVTGERLRVTVTASIGVATGPRADAVDLIRDADIALYRAKDAGRNCYVVFDPPPSGEARRAG